MFFEYPQLLWLELLLIPLIALYLWRTLRGRQPSLTVPDAAQWDDGNGRILAWSRHIPFILRMVALAALIVAIARPRSSENFEKVDTGPHRRRQGHRDGIHRQPAGRPDGHRGLRR